MTIEVDESEFQTIATTPTTATDGVNWQVGKRDNSNYTHNTLISPAIVYGSTTGTGYYPVTHNGDSNHNCHINSDCANFPTDPNNSNNTLFLPLSLKDGTVVASINPPNHK